MKPSVRGVSPAEGALEALIPGVPLRLHSLEPPAADAPQPPASPDRAPAPVTASLSPASSSSSSIPELLSRGGGSACSPPSTSPPASVAGGAAPRDADAKSSALKALAGIGKVVSKSRQTDAEALQAIKAARARVKAEAAGGAGPRHHRTLSTESLSSVSDFSGSPLAMAGAGGGPFGAAPHGAHRRSVSGLPAAALGAPAPVAPHTTPQSYADILAGIGLGDLLALQAAVEAEIQNQLAAAGLSMGGGAAAADPADAALGAHYAAALLAAQQQQQQQQAAAAAAAAPALALQQALAGVAAAAAGGGIEQDRRRVGGSLGHSPLGRSPQKSWPAPARAAHARSQSIDAVVLRKSSPLGSGGSGGSGGALATAAAAPASPAAGLRLGGMDGLVTLDLAALGQGPLPQGPPTARSLDVGAPAPPPPPGAAAFSSDFTFLSDFPAPAGAPTMSLLAPPSPRLASPFTRSAGGGGGGAAAAADLQHQQQLPLLFGNMKLGGLETPW